MILKLLLSASDVGADETDHCPWAMKHRKDTHHRYFKGTRTADLSHTVFQRNNAKLVGIFGQFRVRFQDVVNFADLGIPAPSPPSQ